MMAIGSTCQPAAVPWQASQPRLIKFGLDLSLELLRHRSLFPPGSQKIVQGFAVLVVLQRRGGGSRAPHEDHDRN